MAASWLPCYRYLLGNCQSEYFRSDWQYADDLIKPFLVTYERIWGHSPEAKLTDFKQHVAKSGIMNVYTTKSSALSGIYFEVYKSGLGDTNLFVRSDLVTRSQGYDPMLHTQFDGENPIWYFKLSEDLQKIELYEKQLRLRSSDEQLKQLLKEGAADRWLAEFPIVDQFSNQVESDTNKDPSYVFDARDFVEKDVLGVHMPEDLTLHRLVKVNNFPNNLNFSSKAPPLYRATMTTKTLD